MLPEVQQTFHGVEARPWKVRDPALDSRPKFVTLLGGALTFVRSLGNDAAAKFMYEMYTLVWSNVYE